MKKKMLTLIAIAVIVLFAVIVICDVLVVRYASGRVFADTDSLRETEVGLLLGTSPQRRIDRSRNLFFAYRLDAAEALYRSGKVHKILISGDANSLDGVNEPQVMRDSLVARGLPADIFILDGEGVRTIRSVEKMRALGIDSVIVISQRFHNERTLYIAGHTGMDIHKMQAYNAANPKTLFSVKTYLREYLARVKMFADLLTYREE